MADKSLGPSPCSLSHKIFQVNKSPFARLPAHTISFPPITMVRLPSYGQAVLLFGIELMVMVLHPSTCNAGADCHRSLLYFVRVGGDLRE